MPSTYTTRLLVAVLLGLLLPPVVRGQAPGGFRWVNFKQDASTVLRIEEALKSEDYTAIREIGILGNFALVMTIRRGPEQPTPIGDQWNVYNVSMKTSDVFPLISGYSLDIKDWIKFLPRTPDLGVVYLDCWECEPASLFTALHYDPKAGWRARWVNKENSAQPGITLGVTDVGNPYTNEDVDQVFAVLAPHADVASVGTWYHSRDVTSGKITDVVSRFSVDQTSGVDRSEILSGTDAVKWELRLCSTKETSLGLVGGQSSRACKKIVGQHRS